MTRQCFPDKHKQCSVDSLWVLRSGPAFITVSAVVAVWTVTALGFMNARLPRSNAVRTPRLRGPIPPRDARGNLHLVTRVATYLRVKNWDKFQKQHTSEYIRLYTALLYDAEFNDLPPLAQLLLMKLWLCAAARHGQVSNSAAIGLRQAGLQYSSRYISYWQLLVDKGFLYIERETEERDRERKKATTRRSHSLATESEKTEALENGQTPASPVVPAVREETALSGVGLGSGQSASEGSAQELPTIHIPPRLTEYLSSNSLMCKELENSTSLNARGVDGCGEGDGEGSAGAVSAQASRNATLETDHGTGNHSVPAVNANPVVESPTRQILPVPDTLSHQKFAGSQSGDAKALPPETLPAGLAEQSGAGVGGGGRKRAARKPRDPLAADECWKWLLPYRAVWEAHFGAGSFAHRVAAPYLGPLHRAQGAEAVCANLERYLQRPDINAPNWSHFTQHFAKYGATPVTPLSAAASKPARVCVQCHEPMGPDRGEYDRKPMHAHCINAWQMAGAIAS